MPDWGSTIVLTRKGEERREEGCAGRGVAAAGVSGSASEQSVSDVSFRVETRRVVLCRRDSVAADRPRRRAWIVP